MPKVNNLPIDTQVVAGDKILVTDQNSAQASKLMTLDQLAVYLSITGGADTARDAFIYEIVSEITEDGQAELVTNNQAALSLSTLTLSRVDSQGIDRSPLLQFLNTSTIKITVADALRQNNYGIYTLNSVTGVGTDKVRLNLNHEYGPDVALFAEGNTIAITAQAHGAGGNNVTLPQLRYGVGAPSDEFTGNNGDFYIDIEAHFIYGPKENGHWDAGTSIVGPDGGDGIHGSNLDAELVDGVLSIYQEVYNSNNIPTRSLIAQENIQGPAGTRGSEILTGTTDPVDNVTGEDGDIYINLNDAFLFGPRTNGAWGSGTSIKGNPGSGSTIQVQGPGAYNKNDVEIIEFSGGATVTTDDVDNNKVIVEIAGGGGEGATYTAGDGIDISGTNVISVNPATNSPFGFNAGNELILSGVIDVGNIATSTGRDDNYVLAYDEGNDALKWVENTGGAGSDVQANTSASVTSSNYLKGISIENDGSTLDLRVTNVVPNPGGNGTQLSTVEIDGTTYELPSGGSGDNVVPNPSGTDGDALTRLGINGTNYNVTSINGVTVNGGDAVVGDTNLQDFDDVGGIDVIEGQPKADNSVDVNFKVNSKTGENTMATDGQVLAADGAGSVKWIDIVDDGGTQVKINDTDFNAVNLETGTDRVGGIVVSEHNGDVTFDVSTHGSSSNQLFARNADNTAFVWMDPTAVGIQVEANPGTNSNNEYLNSIKINQTDYNVSLVTGNGDGNGNLSSINIDGVQYQIPQASDAVEGNPSGDATESTLSKLKIGDKIYPVDTVSTSTNAGSSLDQITINGVSYTVDTQDSVEPATSTEYGTVKLGSDSKNNKDINGIPVTLADDRTYAVQVNDSGQMVVYVPWANTSNDPTVQLTTNNFNANTNPSESQSIQYIATLSNYSGVSNLSAKFSASPQGFNDETDSNLDNNGRFTDTIDTSFDGLGDNGKITVTVEVTFTRSDTTIGTITDSVELQLNYVPSVATPSTITFLSNPSGFEFTPSSNIEAFDSGTYDVKQTYDGNAEGWTVPKSGTDINYSPALNADNKVDVPVSDGAFTFEATATISKDGEDDMTNYKLSNDMSKTRIRSIRTGGKKDNTTQFTDAEMQNLTGTTDKLNGGSFKDDIRTFGFVNPSSQNVPAYRDGGEYFYIAYDATLPDIDLANSFYGPSMFQNLTDWTKLDNTPGGFKVYVNASIGPPSDGTGSSYWRITLQS